MALERKKTLNVFREAAAAWGSYDEFPVGPKGTDPMPHLSRSRVAQPFFVVSSADQVLIHMAGSGEIVFRDLEPERMRLVPGDAVYIPAGVPSRVVPDGEVLQIRLKADPPVAEAVAWYCGRCAALVHGRELDDAIVQEGWWRAVGEFNASVALRTCSCGEVHPPVELGDIAWLEVAAALKAGE
jgi:mannose-6-phosphate isomerase-like protein (cupin superfamily)